MLCLCWATVATAETTVPLELQVDLLRRVVRFERGFAARARDQVKVLVVVRPRSGDSESTAASLSKALEAARDIAGKPIQVSLHRFSSAALLKKAVLGAGAQIAYLPPGLEDDMDAIAAGLAGVPVITIATDGEQVDRGAVLGFELVSARPKIALNLGQARRQGLSFEADLLRLARVVP